MQRSLRGAGGGGGGRYVVMSAAGLQGLRGGAPGGSQRSVGGLRCTLSGCVCVCGVRGRRCEIGDGGVS